jgi:2-hydroxychromene-2-carboxylate isomerase
VPVFTTVGSGMKSTSPTAFFALPRLRKSAEKSDARLEWAGRVKQ